MNEWLIDWLLPCSSASKNSLTWCLKLFPDGDDEFNGHSIQVVRQGQGRLYHQGRVCKGSFFFNLKLYLVPNMTWWWDVTKWNFIFISTKMFSPLFLEKLTRRSPRRWQRSRLRPFLPSLTTMAMGRWARRNSSNWWNQKRAKMDSESKCLFCLSFSTHKTTLS